MRAFHGYWTARGNSSRHIVPPGSHPLLNRLAGQEPASTPGPAAGVASPSRHSQQPVGAVQQHDPLAGLHRGWRIPPGELARALRVSQYPESTTIRAERERKEAAAGARTARALEADPSIGVLPTQSARITVVAAIGGLRVTDYDESGAGSWPVPRYAAILDLLEAQLILAPWLTGEQLRAEVIAFGPAWQDRSIRLKRQIRATGALARRPRRVRRTGEHHPELRCGSV
jgi:hypothetical protein